MYKVRRARPEELDEVYLMGGDTWSEGLPREEFLEACRNSEKYQRGRFYVMELGKELVSSLIVYGLAPETIGLASIVTLPELRGNGYASTLIEEVLEQENARHVFLHSDIEPAFYERFGFVALPARYQTGKAVCMLRSPEAEALLDAEGFSAPSYF